MASSLHPGLVTGPGHTALSQDLSGALFAFSRQPTYTMAGKRTPGEDAGALGPDSRAATGPLGLACPETPPSLLSHTFP